MKNDFKKSNKYEYNNRVEISNNLYMKNKWGIETINIISIPEELQINNEETSENNYIISTFNKNKIKNIFILSLLPIIIISELYYRNKLYVFSIELDIILMYFYIL